MSNYIPLEDYGLIGNMRSAALVGKNGSIDWYCHPQFDSPSVFAAILDDHKGGRFSIAPAEDGVTSKQFYWPDTNVLVTRFFSASGIAEIDDFMPVGEALDPKWQHQIVRRVRCSRGKITFKMRCEPAFDYARQSNQVEISQDGALFTSVQGQVMALQSGVALTRTEGGVESVFVLDEDQSCTFVFHGDGSGCGRCPCEEEAERLFQNTIQFWHHWLSQCTYRGRWREAVHRSALAMKLLTHEPTGAIVAAPTASLPEIIGGARNFDYRYTWLRDAAFTVYGFLRIGFTQEAKAFMGWLKARAQDLNTEGADSPLGVMYTIDGKREVPEITLDHLEGYRGSGPVRIGNAASEQLQLDIYGEVLDAVYLYNKHAAPVSFEAWGHLTKLIEWVVKNWRRPDQGIWEPRTAPEQNVFSKLMCWVALDRAIRLGEKRSFPMPRNEWYAERDAIFLEIFEKGWSEEKQSFVQSYESDALDASLLLMPLVFFVSASDPRMVKTLEAIQRSPKGGGLNIDGFVYRYNNEESPDGFDGREGTFNMCSFWLVEALTRAGRDDPKKLTHARLLFERMLAHGNHLQLFAEQTGDRGEALGNFPQALTHLSLISAAFNLDRILGGGDVTSSSSDR